MAPVTGRAGAETRPCRNGRQPSTGLTPSLPPPVSGLRWGAPRHRAERRYPRWCYEEKRYPDGRRNRFRARLLLLRPGHGVLHFVSDRAYDPGGIHLPRGTVTFGLFWEDRPYNLYAWMAPGLTAPRALYFNICDEVTLAAGRFAWRDLWVDVLVTPHGAPRVLDRHEVPAAAPRRVRALIDAAVGRVLADHRTVARYLQALLPALRQGSPNPLR